MIQITGITANPLQQRTVVLDSGISFSITMYYVPLQYGWFITNLTYQDFVLNGLRITNNANMLYQWQKILPFGLACFTSGNREPSQLEDFVSGASNLYILSQAECEAYSAYLNGGSIPA